MGSFFTHHEPATRTIHFQSSNNPGTSNKVETTKYTWYSFLPKAIILQFIRPANLVYLISAVLQSIRVISSLNPITAIAPFIFVIGISLIREGYEDYKRYKKDMEINQRVAHRLVEGVFVNSKWEEILVGDIVKVTNNETIPADFVLLYTSEENSLCFVQTANLDGESNLKTKFAFTQDIKCEPIQFNNLEGKIVVDSPNSNLHSFHGTIAVQGCQEKIIDFDNFMLRETVLKNSQEVVGVVVYTGYDTKIIQNQGRVENKISHVEKKVNIIQSVLLIILILLSATCTIAFAYYHTINHPRANLVYLPPMVTETSLQITLIYFSSFLLLTFLIPISLNVSIEVIKGFLGIFLGFDNKMYYEKIDKKCSVNNITILQELGSVDYVLTDKTGTLTANEMVFKHASIADRCYNSEYICQKIESLKSDPDFHKFWLGLVICHDVVCQPQTKQYQGSSPDQVCFITYAKKIGYQFESRTKNRIIFNIFNKKVSYELLDILPFDSRKRMSVLVRDESDCRIYLYTKGADSAIFQKTLPSKHDQYTNQSIMRFAKQGYRTLLFSYREVSTEEYLVLEMEKKQLRQIKTKKTHTTEQIQAKQHELVQKFEKNLLVIGATAIQDRLQDDVPETIERIQTAGIIVMMITGDKLQTAQNIGYLANFIKQDSKVYRFKAGIPQSAMNNLIEQIIRQKQSHPSQSISIIIQGSTIANLINSQNKNIQKMLITVSSVIFCRSSPKQKGSIVNFVKQRLQGITLAIGDGGNDVNMIQVANVGVGIMGLQGNSASAASDFAIGQFKYLDRLLLHHGRWFYYRLSYFFVFYGWKNLIMTLLLYFYMIDSAFSAATGLSQPFIAIYNIIIGLVLVVYYAVFQQDINDDTHKKISPKLPKFYKQTKQQDLFSYKRYILWTIFAVAISIFIYTTTRYGLGSYYSIDQFGHTGSFSHHSQVLAISLSFIVIMVIISDIKTYTCILAVVVIGIVTIIGTIVFFIFESYVEIGIGNNYLILSMTTLRFWLVILINGGTVYAGKLLIDTILMQLGQTEVAKTIRQRYILENPKIAPSRSVESQLIMNQTNQHA